MTTNQGPEGPSPTPVPSTRRLYRSRDEKWIGGVCGGLAEYFGVDVTIVRIAALILTLAGFSGVLAYLVAWAVIPLEP
jgi:phage shock protein C